MKSNRLSRLRASIAGLTFAVAAIAGAIVPAIDAAAASPVSGQTAAYSASTSRVDLSWTGTGVSGDVYSVVVYSINGQISGASALDASDQVLSGLTSTSASVARYLDPATSTPTDFADGDSVSFRVRTTSADASTASSSFPIVVWNQSAGSTPHASAPRNVNYGVDANGPFLGWTIPLESGTTPISGWLVNVSEADGSDPQSQTLSDPAQTFSSLTYSFVNGLTYKVTVAAINGADGVSPNSAETTFTYTGATQSGGAQITDSAPGAPDTGFSLGLSNPIVVVGIGALAAAILFIAGRKLVRR